MLMPFRDNFALRASVFPFDPISSLTELRHQPGAMLAYLILFLFDVAVFSLTVYKAGKMWRESGGRLVKILFRDGQTSSLSAF